MTRTLAFVAIVILTTHCTKAAGANLLTNGGFELPTVIGGNQMFSAPSTAITGWTVTGGSIDLVENGSVLGNSHTGTQMIDINGLGPGTIQQSFPTIPGASYLLELYYSNNPNPAGAQPSFSASVAAIGNGTLFLQTLVHSGATEANMNWLPYTRAFVANSATTTLRLQSSQGGTNGIYFDTVSVIPEPSTITLMALLLGAGCFVVRKNRRSAH
jgi:choice-of-anchor C domain-containing protein